MTGRRLCHADLHRRGIGPFSGQAVHARHIRQDSADATHRGPRKAGRHDEVLDAYPADRDCLVGSADSIVDMAAWCGPDRAEFVLGADAPLLVPSLR